MNDKLKAYKRNFELFIKFIDHPSRKNAYNMHMAWNESDEAKLCEFPVSISCDDCPLGLRGERGHCLAWLPFLSSIDDNKVATLHLKCIEFLQLYKTLMNEETLETFRKIGEELNRR